MTTNQSEAITAAVAPVVQNITANIPPLDAFKPGWYAVNRTKEPDGEAEVTIYDVIGGWGISAQQFVNDLKAIEATRIHLRLNTPGGEIFDGTAIHNALVEHPAEIIVHVDGVAASAGSFIAMSGDEIRMADNAYMMIHNARGGVMGEADDMRRYADLLEKMNGVIAGMYERKTGKPRKHWQALMDDETWFTAEEAKAQGLADVVESPTKKASGVKAAFDFKIYNKIPDPVRRMWGIDSKTSAAPAATLAPETLPENQSQSASDVPASATSTKETSMSTPDTTPAPTQPAASPAVAAAEQRQHQMVELNKTAIENFKEQGRQSGVPEGQKAEYERVIAILDIHKGQHLNVAEKSIRLKHSPDFALMAFEQATEADARLKESLDAKNLEISRLLALQATGGYSGGLSMALASTVDDDKRQGPLTTDEAKAQAEHEWDTSPTARKSARTKDIYVLARTAELDGTHRTFAREQIEA